MRSAARPTVALASDISRAWFCSASLTLCPHVSTSRRISQENQIPTTETTPVPHHQSQDASALRKAVAQVAFKRLLFRDE